MYRVGKTVPPKRQILKDISLSFFPGAKIGMLGLNGAGKSSHAAHHGRRRHRDRRRGDARCPISRSAIWSKNRNSIPTKTVRETVEEGLGELVAARKRLDEIYAAYGEPDADFDKLAEEQAKLEALLHAQGDDLDQQLEIAADALRLPPWDAPVGPLSGGEKRRVALCRLLLSKPDMLLLDEPTNHLDAESVEWLEQFLQRFPGTVVAVTHDRYFLDNAAEWILELDRGRGIPWKGNYSSWLDQKQERLAQEEATESARQKALKRELEWVPPRRQGPPVQEQEPPRAIRRDVELRISEAQRDAGDLHPRRRAPGRQSHRVQWRPQSLRRRLLMDDVSFTIPPGAIVGIIGPNGAGKSTLFRMIAGKEKPDAGTIAIGRAVKLGVVDQSREALDDAKTVWEDVSGGLDVLQVGRFEMPSRAYLGRFNFKGGDQQKPVGELSGGERGRLHLAKTLISGANVLLLDEPSNDLDVETLRALEDALLNSPAA